MTDAIKSFDDIPIIAIPPEENRRSVPYLLRMGIEHAPIFRRRTPRRITKRYAPWQVYLIGPEANRLVMQTEREKFSHARGWRAYFGGVWNENLMYLDHEDHARHRRLMNPAFLPSAMARYIHALHTITVEQTEDWGERDSVDIRDATRHLAFRGVAEVLLGFPPAATATLHALRDQLTRNPHEYRKPAYSAHIQTHRTRFNAFLSDLVAQHTSTDSDNLVALLTAAHNSPDHPLSSEYLLGHLHVLLEAGHTTTMDTAMWTLGFLATHPAYLARVRAEVDAAHQTYAEVNLEMLKGLTLLGRAIDEAGRLRTPVDTAPRGVLADFTFAEYVIPQGSFIRLHLGACHRLPSIFADPGTFDPDRFAPPREEHKRTPYAFVLYGGGPRICIGQWFAQNEIKAFISHVIHTYDIEPLPGLTPPSVFDPSNPDDALPGGMPIRFRRR
jgi:cytochrome P450